MQSMKKLIFGSIRAGASSLNIHVSNEGQVSVEDSASFFTPELMNLVGSDKVEREGKLSSSALQRCGTLSLLGRVSKLELSAVTRYGIIGKLIRFGNNSEKTENQQLSKGFKTRIVVQLFLPILLSIKSFVS